MKNVFKYIYSKFFLFYAHYFSTFTVSGYLTLLIQLKVFLLHITCIQTYYLHTKGLIWNAYVCYKISCIKNTHTQPTVLKVQQPFVLLLFPRIIWEKLNIYLGEDEDYLLDLYKYKIFLALGLVTRSGQAIPIPNFPAFVIMS